MGVNLVVFGYEQGHRHYVERRANGGRLVLQAATEGFEFALPTQLKVGGKPIGVEIRSAARRQMGTLYDLRDGKMAERFRRWKARDASNAYMAAFNLDFGDVTLDDLNAQPVAKVLSEQAQRLHFGLRDYYRVEMEIASSVGLGKIGSVGGAAAASVTMESDGTRLTSLTQELRASVFASVLAVLLKRLRPIERGEVEVNRLAVELSARKEVTLAATLTTGDDGELNALVLSLTLPWQVAPTRLDSGSSFAGLLLQSAAHPSPQPGVLVVRRVVPMTTPERRTAALALFTAPGPRSVADVLGIDGDDLDLTVDQYSSRTIDAALIAPSLPVGLGLGFERSKNASELSLAWSRRLGTDGWLEREECRTDRPQVAPEVAVAKMPLAKPGYQNDCPRRPRAVALPAKATCVRIYDVDLDGDEFPDRLLVYRVDKRWWLRAVTDDGVLSTLGWVRVEVWGDQAWLEMHRDVDGVPGDELVVGMAVGANTLHYGLVTWTNDRLRDVGIELSSGGGWAYGSDFLFEDVTGDGTPEILQRGVFRIGTGTLWEWSEEQWAWRGKTVVPLGSREAVSRLPDNRRLERPAGLPAQAPRPVSSATAAATRFLAAWEQSDRATMRDLSGVDHQTGSSGIDAIDLDLPGSVVAQYRQRLRCHADAPPPGPGLSFASCTAVLSGRPVLVVSMHSAGGTGHGWLVENVGLLVGD
jgi:hypothetical protein